MSLDWDTAAFLPSPSSRTSTVSSGSLVHPPLPFSFHTLSPVASLPRPPRCLTPYPHQAHFPRPPLPSPLAAATFDDLDLDNDLSLIKVPKRHDDALCSPSTALCPRTRPYHGPIALRMSSLSPTSPTDTTFPTNQPLHLPNSSISLKSVPIPLSPSAKHYMESKERERRRSRPDPIYVPIQSPIHHHPRVASPRTAMPRLIDTLATAKHPAVHLHGGGSVPLPRTPCGVDMTPARTAMPLTAKRIGVRPGNGGRSGISSDQGELDAEPRLRDEPSPGWADFGEKRQDDDGTRAS